MRRDRSGRNLALVLVLMGLSAVAGPVVAAAADVQVAVAANFTLPLDAVGAAFTKATGHHLVVSAGSTGKLAAQIQNGAPFEVLLAADSERPAALEKQGATVAGSRFTYALGNLVLWSADARQIDPKADLHQLATGTFKHLAIANPDLAPYGAAAREALTHLGLWQPLAPRLVQGEDIGQAFQFVASGAAELGFVALSQVYADAGGPGKPLHGSMLAVPHDLYHPIEQQAVLLLKGQNSAAARAFLDFLKTPATRSLIARYGYQVP